MSFVGRSRTRIPPIRPIRPPDTFTQNRSFARNPKLLLLSSPSTRPQLVFLSPHTYRNGAPGQWQFPRLLTTERKALFEQQARLGVRYTLIGVAVTAFILFEGFTITHELLEREYPTPHDWGMRTRCNYHSAKGLEHPYARGLEITDWGLAGYAWKALVTRLEDPAIEGKDVIQQVEGGIYIPGAGDAGYDISTKSEPWRRGYYEALMGCAQAAEHLDSKVLDKTRNHIFPKDYVIGPSNPDPKPTPPWRPSAPLEENCVPAFDGPQTYYTKILTTKGFTTKQQVRAALAFGEWLDFQGQHEAAGEAFKWGLDIACSAVPSPTDIIDTRTGVIKADTPLVTENILSAATAYATHQAQTANASAALPILLSALRARRSVAIDRSRVSKEPSFAEKYDTRQQTDIGAFITYLRATTDIFRKVPYPTAEPSGDEPFHRTLDTSGEEASLMAYIGEVLFASDKTQRKAGLKFIREAVELADEMSRSGEVTEGASRKAVATMEVGMSNWQIMVETMQREAELAGVGEGTKSQGGLWSWISQSKVSSAKVEGLAEDAANEAVKLELGKAQVSKNRLRQRFEEMDMKAPLWGSWLLSVY